MGDRLQEIREREAAATAGPWQAQEYDDHLGDEGCAILAGNGMGQRGIAYSLPYSWHGQDAVEADAEFIAQAREDVPFLLEQVDTYRAHVEADHAKLEQVAELVQQWRAKGAQADFLGTTNIWDHVAYQLTQVLAKE